VRLLTPWSRYRRYVADELEPVWEDEALRVAGVNTVNPLDWQRGKLNAGRIARMRRAFRDATPGGFRIVVAHHPFVHLATERKALLRGAADGLAALQELRVDIVLSGHLHSWRAESFSPEGGGRAVVMVQAGTGLSTRMRGEPNDFNVLRLDGEEVTVERFAAGDEDAFDKMSEARFRRGPAGWRRIDAAPSA
jgi:predicted phosphodiesterase